MRARFAASILIAGAVVLGTAGCTFYSPIPTDFPYASADGADLTIGQVKVRNALLVTDEGSVSSLAMAVSNDGDERVQVLFQYNFDEGNPGEFSISLEPGEFISYGSELEPPIVLAGVEVPVGGDFAIFVQYGSETGRIMRVPVYDGQLERFDEIEPEIPEVIVVPTPGPETEPTPAPETEE